MIIGSNNNNNKKNNFINNYTNKNMTFNNNSDQTNNKIPINTNEFNQPNQYNNVMDRNEMKNKSFSMLQERLKNGTISIDEFNKKCIELGKHNK